MPPRLSSLTLLLLAPLAGCPTPARAPASPAGERQSVLLVLAHPDDETMIGATLGRLKEQRIPVDAIYATRGEGGKLVVIENGQPKEIDPDDAALARMRANEMAAAARHYGIRRHVILKEPDQPFEDPVTRQPTRDVQRFLESKVWNIPALEREISRFAAATQPSVVITLRPDARATHAHHQAIGAIALRLFEQRRLGNRAAEIYAVNHASGCGAATPLPGPGELRIRRSSFSAALGKSYGAFQQEGRRLHRSQLVAHKPAATHDEVLAPLGRRGDSALLRAMLGLDEAPAGRS